MPEKRWKIAERRVARMFLTERALQEGRKGFDFISKWVIGQVKSREKFPKWLMEAVSEVRLQAKGTGKLPLVALVEKNRRGFLIVIDSRDFYEFFGSVCEGEESTEDLIEADPLGEMMDAMFEAVHEEEEPLDIDGSKDEYL